jgi:hypothetical protein
MTRGLEALIQEVEQSQVDRTRNRSTFEQDLDDSSTATSDQARRQGGQNHERDGNSGVSYSEVMDQESDSSNHLPRMWIRPSAPLARLGSFLGEDSGSELQLLAANIRESNASIASMIGEAFPRSESPMPLLNPASYYGPHHPPNWDETRPQSDSPGSIAHRWRAKRRKLDSDDHREGLSGFSYGHYGQVVPGLLKMEIASCDGGSYYDDNGESSWPGNVLLDDSSVYCTKKGNCNLILKHRGGAPFSLKRIVIRAPKKGFDAAYVDTMMAPSKLLKKCSCFTGSKKAWYLFL